MPHTRTRRWPNIVLAIGLFICAAGLLATVSPVSSLLARTGIVPTTPVNQGDVITIGPYVGQRSRCTVGFVDHTQHLLVTAGHCHNADGDTVYNSRNQPVGTLTTSSEFTGGEDIAIIPTDALGDNTYTTNDYRVSADYGYGERVCSWGSTTQVVRCGGVTRADGNVLRVDAGMVGDHGDSGGPVWREATGDFVGVYTGEVTTTYTDGTVVQEAEVEVF